MALFGKKLSTLDEIKKAYENLSDEDKETFKQSITDRVDESVAAQKEDEGEKSEQSAEAEIHEALGEEHAEDKGETEELGEKDDTPKEEAEDKRDETDEKSSEVETSETEDKPEDVSKEQVDNRDEIIKGLTDRVTALENGLKELDELKAAMDEYNKKNAERFGYKGKTDTEKKSFNDMSVKELEERQKMKI